LSEGLQAEHLEQLRQARATLETPGFAIRAVNLVGMPIERGMEKLPANWQERVVTVSRTALERAADVALWSIDPDSPQPTSDLLHKLAVSVSGAAGGAFGLAALAVELPVSTTIMLRSIADIARCEGEDLRVPATRLACVEVFALGGRASGDDATESAYYVARAALAKSVGEAARFLAANRGARLTAPPVVRFMTNVAGRFGVQVSEKAAAQAVPIVGAAGGALINNLFISHFQDMARGHFTVRRLERIYSPAQVEEAYQALGAMRAPPAG
jgi:hypothetical protein